MKNFFKKLALVLALAMVVTVVAPAAASKSEAASVAISKKEAKVSIGKSYNFNVKNKVAGSKYAWSSSDESVATVKSNGVAKGLKVGEATISCKITLPNKKTTTVKGTLVVCPDATKVTINNEVAKLTVGQSHDFNRDIEPANTVNKTYWTVKLNGAVVADTKAGTGAAIMSEKGVFTPAKAGVYTITAQASRSKTATKMRGEADTVVVTVDPAALKTAEVVAAKYDDNTPNQVLSIKVNGVDTTAADLFLQGYTVEFKAYDKNSADAAIFEGATAGTPVNTSSNGRLAASKTTALAKGDYYVVLTVSKGNEIAVSAKTKIVIDNLNAVATVVDNVKLVASYIEYLEGNTLIPVGGTQITSNTLVAGQNPDVVVVESLKVTVNGATSTLKAATGLADVTIASSNVAVVKVGKTAGTLTITAVGPGTANVTLTYNGVNTVIPFTVTNVARKVSSITVNTGSLVAVKNGTTTLKFTVKDQYNNPLNVNATLFDVIPADASVATVGTVAADANDSAKGVFVATVNGLKAGTTQLSIRYNNVAKAGASVRVTDNTGVATTKLELVKSNTTSDDNVLAMVNPNDDSVIFALNQYNAEGVYLDSVLINNPTMISIADPTIVAPSLVVGYKTVEFVALKAGTTDVVIKDGLTSYKFTLTVTNIIPTLTNVSFKAAPETYVGKTVSYKDVFQVATQANGADPIITGLTIANKADSCATRVAADGAIYIDYNNDGDNVGDATEVALGYIVTPVIEYAKGTGNISAPANFESNMTVNAKPTVASIIFKVTNGGTGANYKVIASTTIEVNVQ